jgi:histone H2A
MADAETKKPTDENEKEEKKKRPAVSRSKRADLKMPVGRIGRQMRKSKVHPGYVGDNAVAAMTAIMEQFAIAIYEAAGEEAVAQKKTRIKPRHIYAAAKKDPDLKILLDGCIFATSDVKSADNKVKKEVIQESLKKRREASVRDKKSLETLWQQTRKVEQLKKLAAADRKRKKEADAAAAEESATKKRKGGKKTGGEPPKKKQKK